jgi:PAS domain S-box-containing protein
LRKERDRAQTYLDYAGAMIVVLDTGGKVKLMNRKGCQVLGFAESDIEGSDWFETCVPGRISREARAAFDGMLSGEIGLDEPLETPVLTREGEERLVTWHCTLLRNDEGRVTGVLSAGEDVTDRRRMEEALRATERIEAIGALASGVAHNFSNILGVIDGHASSMREQLAPHTAVHRDCIEILNASRHAGDLTKRLTRLARVTGAADKAEVEPISLNALLRNTVELVEHNFGDRGVAVRVKRPEKMPWVYADHGQLVDALTHILINAVEAMPEGGTITVDTVEKKISGSKSDPVADKGVYVGLRIRDTGVGMPRDVRDHVFDAFFSTKQESAGFGLGLSVAQSMVRGMGGWIDVRSRRGSGTLFRIFLAKAAGSDSAPATGSAAGISDHGILLIDDDNELLSRMKDALETAGCKVHAANSGNAALAAHEQHAADISVTVLDLIIPGSDSKHVLEQILNREPQANIIVTSGFSRDYVRHTLSIGAWKFLQKPFDEDQLIEAVGSLVNKPE